MAQVDQSKRKVRARRHGRRDFGSVVPASDPMPVANSHNSVMPTFLSIAYDVTGAHARRPSGASVGEPMRRMAQSASTSKGSLVRTDEARRAAIGDSCGVE